MGEPALKEDDPEKKEDVKTTENEEAGKGQPADPGADIDGVGIDMDAEADMDALHILPLSIIPFETPGLKRARLIKNVRLETVVEMFKDESAGSGQVRIEHLPKVFGWPPGEIHPDHAKLDRLASMSSYDVFSLRIELRRLGIDVEDHVQLRLSKKKNEELTEYMRDFTRPLIQQVYSDVDQEITDVRQIIDMFKNPDKEQAIKNLRRLSESLDVPLEDIPRFLEDYGDIFLSLAYFKQCLDRIVPIILDFLQALGELQNNFHLRHDKNLMNTCAYMEETLNNTMASITGRFESFHRHSSAMWENITADSFKRVKQLITSHHTTVGGVLCGLAVKMNVWNEKFGNDKGGPQARADFVMSEMRHGIDKIHQIECSAPKISDI